MRDGDTKGLRKPGAFQFRCHKYTEIRGSPNVSAIGLHDLVLNFHGQAVIDQGVGQQGIMLVGVGIDRIHVGRPNAALSLLVAQGAPSPRQRQTSQSIKRVGSDTAQLGRVALSCRLEGGDMRAIEPGIT